ncbi:hypothetical protein ACIBHY_51390 [Nonomuraea sp. NPDC050547]
MSTTTGQNGFPSRLPELTQAFPELAALSGALRKAIGDGVRSRRPSSAW